MVLLLLHAAILVVVLCTQTVHGQQTPAIPASVTVVGLNCHPSSNARYVLQPTALNGKPRWAGDGDTLYWTPDVRETCLVNSPSGTPAWVLDAVDDDDPRCFAILPWAAFSTNFLPPDGLSNWEELCGGSFRDSALTLTVNCTALAESTMALPSCAGIADRTCPEACAEVWLVASARCVGKSAAEFEARAPLGTTAACGATVAALLATSPRTVTVTGMECCGCNHPGSVNAEYMLQPVTLNNRPHYTTADGNWHLYWNPLDWFDGVPEWQLGPSSASPPLSTGAEITALATISSPAEHPPITAIWTEWCNGEWVNSRLQIKPSQPDFARCASALGELAPLLTATCCEREDAFNCGLKGTMPSRCSMDCAHIWQSYAVRCLDQRVHVRRDHVRLVVP